MSASASVAKKLQPHPATPPEVETWITGNKMFLDDEACECLRKMNPVDQRRVISDGGLRECHTPVAVIKSRVRKAKDAEILLSGGKIPDRKNPSQPEGPAVSMFMPEETIFLTSYYMHGQPTEVKASQSRFAAAAGTPAAEGESAKEDPAHMEGTIADVGGVIEVGPKAKYGCQKGQRVRVVGQTPVLWLCKDADDVDKMINKQHKNNGWKWIFASTASTSQDSATKLSTAAEQKQAAQIDAKEAPVAPAAANEKVAEETEEKIEKEAEEKAEDAKEKKKEKGGKAEKAEDAKTKKKDSKGEKAEAVEDAKAKKGKKGEGVKKPEKKVEEEKKRRKRSPSRSSSSGKKASKKKKPPPKSSRSKRKRSTSNSESSQRSSDSGSESSGRRKKTKKR